MREAFGLIWAALVRLFRSRASLVAEILVLRHQINIRRRHLPKRQTFSAMDRLIFVGLYRLAPTILNALAILKPETVMEWHRVGFRSFWRWKSRRRGGRPTVPPEIRKLRLHHLHGPQPVRKTLSFFRHPVPQIRRPEADGERACGAKVVMHLAVGSCRHCRPSFFLELAQMRSPARSAVPPIPEEKRTSWNRRD